MSGELKAMLDHAESQEARKQREIASGFRCASCGMRKEQGGVCLHGAQPSWEYAVKSPDGSFVWFPTKEAAEAHIAWRRSWARRLKVVKRKER